MFRKNVLTIMVLLGMMSVIPAAQGSIVFTLNESTCCGSGPFGTVTLDQTTANLVTVTETLNTGVNWAGTGAGEALEFNISGDPAINIVIAAANTANFSAGVGSATASPYGTFDYFVHCTTCSGGTGPSGTLTFTVSLVSNTALNISSFEVKSGPPPQGATPSYVASDICLQSLQPGACTGNAGASSFDIKNNPNVPEPITSGLVGTGLISLFFLRRRVRG